MSSISLESMGAAPTASSSTRQVTPAFARSQMAPATSDAMSPVQ
jgi:hypothetical protein